MADGTVLNPGTGGDDIVTEDLGTQKLAVSKIYTGAANVSGGPVTADNPFPAAASYQDDQVRLMKAILVELRLMNTYLSYLLTSAGVRVPRNDAEDIESSLDAGKVS